LDSVVSELLGLCVGWMCLGWVGLRGQRSECFKWKTPILESRVGLGLAAWKVAWEGWLDLRGEVGEVCVCLNRCLCCCWTQVSLQGVVVDVVVGAGCLVYFNLQFDILRSLIHI
jgi:hypothetical protein